MAWPVVDVSAIIDRWRPLTEAEAAIAPTRLEDAEAELTTELRLRGLTGTPTFETVEEAEAWEKLYTRTVVDAVRGYLLNTDGWSEERIAIDDFDRTIRRNGNVATGQIRFTDAQIDKLVPRTRRRRTAFSIRLGTS